MYMNGSMQESGHRDVDSMVARGTLLPNLMPRCYLDIQQETQEMLHAAAPTMLYSAVVPLDLIPHQGGLRPVRYQGLRHGEN